MVPGCFRDWQDWTGLVTLGYGTQVGNLGFIFIEEINFICLFIWVKIKSHFLLECQIINSIAVTRVLVNLYPPLRRDFYRLLIATSIDYRVQCYLFIKLLKVGLSPSKKVCFICFNESAIKMMKNAFYLILKAFFLHKVLKFLSLLFGHIEKTTWLER